MKKKSKEPDHSVERLKAWLGFLGSFAWPVVILVLVLMFRSQLTELTKRIESGEIAGAKFSFQEAAAGYIQNSIGELAQESDPIRRESLANDIRSVASALGAVNPKSLGMMITASDSCHYWVDPAHDKLINLQQIEKLGLAKLEDRIRDGKAEYSIRFTDKGVHLLKSIGISQEDLDSNCD